MPFHFLTTKILYSIEYQTTKLAKIRVMNRPDGGGREAHTTHVFFFFETKGGAKDLPHLIN
jgi:hypothetical protein